MTQYNYFKNIKANRDKKSAPSKQYDLLSPETLANPYPLYHQLQSEHPVYLDGSLGCWILTRYADVANGFSDIRLSSERMRVDRIRGSAWEQLRPLFQATSMQMVFLDPPDHTRLRALMSKAFTPRAIEMARPRIQQIVDDLLAELQREGHMDIIRDLAYPLPATVIAEMLGVPASDHQYIKKWSGDLAVFMGNPTRLDTSQQALQSLLELMDYFRYLVNHRRENPQDDLLSLFVHAEEQGTFLHEEEILVNCALLLFGGHETTTNLLGNGLLALLQMQEQREKLQTTPSLIESAVEEFLRYDSPTQWTGRIAKESIDIGSTCIRKGQGVMLMIGAANRDPAQFLNPDQLDITRSDNRHLAFGYSRHFCLGAALARLEGKIAFQSILHFLPTMHITDEHLQWTENSALRALLHLHISI